MSKKKLFPLVVLLICGGTQIAQAQRPPLFRSNQPTVLPRVPNLEPRPPQGSKPEEQWRIERRATERTPVASFLDSLKGSDASLEVMVNRSKLLTTKEPIARENGVAVIAVSDPTILDFDVLPDSKMIRLMGRRVGTTDLTFVTGNGDTYTFAVHVVYDLELLRAHLKQLFPSAFLRLGQLRDHVVVEGQARNNAQISQIIDTITAYLSSVQVIATTSSSSGAQPSAVEEGRRRDANEEVPADPRNDAGADTEQNQQAGNFDDGAPGSDERSSGKPGVAVEFGGRGGGAARRANPRIINLIKVPGPKQVMLKVQIAELDRSSLRQIGSDLITSIGNNGVATFGAGVTMPTFDLNGDLTNLLFPTTTGTLVGVFDSASFNVVMTALRQNNVATVLAEPNLVTLDGHTARFQSGGEFPVPVAQQGGGIGNNTVQFKDFGVQLGFVPFILDEGVIRLRVEPEVSNIAEDLAVTLIANGSPIPGLRTRNASTTVELREGQTLAIAGLLNREMDNTTARIPWLGDLPYVGPLFGNTIAQVIEQELLVAVTPYLVDAVNQDQRTMLPGQEIAEPNDLEFYFLQRIEGRTGIPHRATGQWDNPFHKQSQIQLERQYFTGPVGLSD